MILGVRQRRWLFWVGTVWLCAAALCCPAGALAQDTAADGANHSEPPQSFLQIVHAGGLVGYLTMSLSVAAAAVVIDHLFTVRGERLMPGRLIEPLRDAIKQGQLSKAEQLCRQQPSLLSQALHAGLTEAAADWAVVEKAVEDCLAEQAARLYRRVEYLAVIGNIAPMLGLLGTVIGMVMAFREVAVTQGAARAADLAQGIYLALVTTVQGLVVAIPSLAAFAVLRNRQDELLTEVAAKAHSLLAPLRRRRPGGAAVEPPPVVDSL